MSRLSIIITHVSDPALSGTLASIRETAGDNATIIVVDDASGTDIEATCPNLPLANKVVKLKHRCGVGPARHLGVMHARSDFVLFCDSHMVFPQHWLAPAIARLEDHRKTIFCTTCVGLDKMHMQLDAPAALYHGARINWSGVDPNDRMKQQVLEAVWNKQVQADNSEIGAVMGGAYLCSREWFLQLSALRFLRTWGSDEILLSLASWLSGGDCRIITEFGIAHIFLSKGQRQTWTCPGGVTIYNKLFAMHTLLPENFAQELKGKLKSLTDAREWALTEDMVRRDWHIFDLERRRFQAMFTKELGWYRERFDVS